MEINLLADIFIEKIAESNLLKNIEKEKEFKKNRNIFNFLISHNIFPIIHGEELSSFLGKGITSRTFEVDYKGKHAVAKITKDYSTFYNYKEMKEIREILPPKYKKHMVNIYELLHNEKNKYYIVVTEYLIPLNRNIKDILFYIKSGKNWKLSEMSYFRQGQVLNINNIKNIIKFSHDLYKMQNKAILEKLPEKLLSLFTNYKNKPITSKFTLEILPTFIWKETKDLETDKDLLNKFIIHLSKSLINNILGSIQTFYDKEHQDMYPNIVLQSTPEVKSFVQFVNNLDTYGVRFGDLHSENIMERPYTGDIVISDLSHFSI